MPTLKDKLKAVALTIVVFIIFFGVFEYVSINYYLNFFFFTSTGQNISDLVTVISFSIAVARCLYIVLPRSIRLVTMITVLSFIDGASLYSMVPANGCPVTSDTNIPYAPSDYLSANFSRDGKTLILMDKAGEIHIGKVSLNHYEEIMVLPSAYGVQALSQDGRYLVYSDDSIGLPTLSVWDAQTNKVRNIIPTPTDIKSVALSPDGKMLAISTGDKNTGKYYAQLWDTVSGQPIGQAMNDNAEKVASIGFQEWRINSLTFSPDSKILASTHCANFIDGCFWGELSLWDVATQQKIIDSLKTPQRGEFGHLVFSPDGKIIASSNWTNEPFSISSGDASVVLWNASNGQQQQVLQCHDFKGGITGIAFNADGNLLAEVTSGYVSGQDINGVQLWESLTGKRIAKLDTGYESLLAVAFDPSGNLTAVDGNGTIWFWSMGTQRTVQPILLGTVKIPLKTTVTLFDYLTAPDSG